MALLNRAGVRNLIRHKLNKLTEQDEYRLFGSGENRSGYPAASHPTPTNAQIDEQLDEAVKFVNRKAKLGHEQTLEVTVSAQTDNGPYALTLQTTLPTGTQQLGTLLQVKHAEWSETGSDFFTPLFPRSREEFDSEKTIYRNAGPNIPRWYWIEGYTLYLYPASSAGGTLTLIVTTSIPKFTSDTDTLSVLPDDYQSAIWDIAASFVAGIQQDDAEMGAAEQKYMQRGMDGLADIFDWKRDVSAQEEARTTVRTDRRLTRRRGRGRYIWPNEGVVDWKI